MNEALAGTQLHAVFRLLDGRLALNEAPPIDMVVCGGAAMILMGLNSRDAHPRCIAGIPHAVETPT